MTVSTPAQLRAKATYRAKQLAKATAQAKRVEELEEALRRIAALPSVTAETEAFRSQQEGRLNEQARWIATKALEGSAKP